MAPALFVAVAALLVPAAAQAQVTAPQLTGSIDQVPLGLMSGVVGTATLTLSNRGTNTATGTVNRLYLSTDATLDAGDAEIGAWTGDIVNGDTVVTATISVPAATPNGSYNLILFVDAQDSWQELDETDNQVSVGPFFTAFELSATGIRVLNPRGVNAGDTIDLEIDFANRGIPYSGSVTLDVGASSDLAIDAADPGLGTVTVNLTGATSETVQTSFTMPAIPPGTYHPFVGVDPANAIVETNELNNQFLDNATFDTGPDFEAASVTIPAFVTPGATADVTTTINSLAVPFTGTVPYRLWASADDTLDTANDIDLGMFTAALAGEATVSDTRAVTFAGTIAAGYYYVFAVVDPMGAIPEVSSTNNEIVSATQIANAPDFFAESAGSTPSSLEIGDNITVTADSRNTGLPFVGNVPFTVYASLDPVFDPGDQPIYNGLVFYTGTDTGVPVNVTFPFRALPGDPQVRPGSYTIIVRIDATNLHDEADETNNWDAGGRVTLQGSDLLPTTITAPSVAFIGLPLRVNIEIENQGVADANGFRYSYFLSENDIIRVNDQRVFTSASATIASGSSAVFEDFVTLPSLTSTACMWLGIIVNDRGDVAETNINNNTRRIFDCIEIVFPIPDMTAQIIDTPTVAAAGEELAVTRLLLNEGTADAPRFSYTYYLSSNPTISTDDIPIGTFSGSVPVGADDYGIDVLQIPSQVSEGNYFIGLIVDPDDDLDEVIEDNNTAVGPQIPVFSAAIRFGTSSLPNATVGVDYNIGVFAEGAPLALTWSVANGSLPDGLSLDANSGIISGIPTDEGLYEFVLRASAGTAFADKPFAIRVLSPTVDLRVATQSLPTAISGRAYSAQLVGVGGQVPYTWAPVSDLPVGMELSEDGLLSGTPQTPGALPITVRVTDSLGNASSKELVLNVISANQSLQIIQIPLPGAVVDSPYCDPEPIRFEAQNGTEPYAWSLIGDAPSGMTLNANGELCGTPDTVGEFPITVRVQDATGLFDTSLFLLDVDDGTSLAVSTFSLDPAKQDEPYEFTLSVIRGAAPYTWSVVQRTGALPAGLTLSSDGVLSGTPIESGTFAFVVQVVDAQLRTDVQPLSIFVEPPPPTVTEPDGGCTCANDAAPDQPWASMVALLGVAGVLLRRRRR